MSDTPLQAAIAANTDGLEAFASGHPERASQLLRQAYRHVPDQPAILVNLGLALMQQGRVAQAERCYRLALHSPDLRHRRSAAKNLGFLYLWEGRFQEGWHWHGQRFAGESFLETQWKGDPLNGARLTIWNDVGMGDAFHFARYTQPLVARGERVRLAVHGSQVELFQRHLAWPLAEVVDRNAIDRTAGVHIPLMSLIPVLDANTSWGRSFGQATWQLAEPSPDASAIGLCWASNPQDRTMHVYKSSQPELLLAKGQASAAILSLQTDERDAHDRLGLSPAPPSWAQTLARIGHCRRVLSVDTAVAHLAAGAQVPVELWLGPIPDWRWRQFPEQGHALGQLWYPSLSLLA